MEDALLALAILSVVALPIAVLILFLTQSTLRRRLRAAERALVRQAEAQADLSARLQALEGGDRPIAARAAPEAAGMAAKTAEAVAPETAPEGLPQDRATAGRQAGPWDAVATDRDEQLPDTGQDRPLVLRRDRVGDLVRWLRDNWVYAVSAVSLALAGIFLVQYGIEAGLLPPPLRVIAALAFGAALIAAGEWIRRRHGDTQGATAQLPSTFSGAGVVAMMGAILAARQLYGLIGPELAFAALLAIAAGAVVLGWFHGPFLAAIGLIGAAAAPMIVGGSSTDAQWLYAHYGLIGALGLAVDAVRRWAWISVLALLLAYGGGLLLLDGIGGLRAAAVLFAVLPILAMALPVRRLWPDHAGPMVAERLLGGRGTAWPSFPTRLAAGSMLASVAILTGLVSPRDVVDGLLILALLAGLSLAVALWARGAPGLGDLWLLPVAGFLVRLVGEVDGPGPILRDLLAQTIALRPPETDAPATITLIVLLATAISAGAALRSLSGRDHPALWSIGAALAAPVTVLVIELMWSPAATIGAYPWALHAIALAAAAVGLALAFARIDGEDRRRVAHATLAALALIAFAQFAILTKGALTLALAVLLVVAAALDRRFRLPEMALFLQAGVLCLGYRFVIDPGMVWALEAPLWESALAFVGALVAFVAALALVGPLDRRGARVFLESGFFSTAALFANVSILRGLEHWVPNRLESYWSIALNALPWVIVTLVQLHRLQLGGWMRFVRLAIALVAGLLGFGGLAVALVFLNPLLVRDPVFGPPIADTLAVAYLLPAAVIVAALRYLRHLPRMVWLFLLAIACVLAAVYAGLEIRRFWQGDILNRPDLPQGELYGYTIALLVTGAALLWQALARRSVGLRRLAMGLIALTVAKVFLIDASGLTGLTRVFSFLALGLSLAALAWLNRWASGVQGAGRAGAGRDDPSV